MALQTIKGGLWIPDPVHFFDTANSFNLDNFLLDAADEKAAFVFCAPEDGVIDQLEFLTGTVTTGATVDVRLETVDLATGDPSGTLATVNSNASVVIADTDDNVWKTATLTATHTVTKGDKLAMVIVNPTVSFGNLNIRISSNVLSGFPYASLFTTVWTKNQRVPLMAIRYQTTTYHVILGGVLPQLANSPLTFNVDTAAQDEAGMIFQLPFPARLRSAKLLIDLDGDADVVVYDSNGTSVLTSASLDKDVRSRNARDPFFIEFTGKTALLANTNYRCVVKPTTTTSVILATYTVNAAALLDAVSGGQNFHYTSRADAGAWTQTTTRRPGIFLYFDQFGDDVGGAGGGGAVGSRFIRTRKKRAYGLR